MNSKIASNLYTSFLYGVIMLICGCFNVLIAEVPLTEAIASYTIDVVLDIDNKELHANQTIYWKNTSTDTIKELHFHIYYNAFKSTESTFMSERSDMPDILERENECPWGFTTIEEILDENSTSLLSSMTFIQPDDNNEKDETVFKITLTEPLLPQQKTDIHLIWKAKIPNIMPRTGYNKEFYFMAQWFPKIGVYEPAGMRFATTGQWNCHQYHSKGEYYADFGIYDVTIHTPKNYIVGASGSLIEKQESDNETIWHYKTKEVIDFAWTASPHYVIQTRQWKHVSLQLYTYPHHSHFGLRYLNTIEQALDFLESHLGVYPYETLSIIDPPIHGIFTGGMEYPNLITTLSFCFLPIGVRTPETLAVHELIHQYFMQMVATNEAEEPWMDEGLTTYYECRILDHIYGENNSTIDLHGIKVGSKAYNRTEFFNMAHPEIGSNDLKSWEFEHGGYGPISYNKTAIWLQTLEGIIGTETMDEAMKQYFQDWKFKHPCRDDFIESITNTVVQKHGNEYGENLDWYFNQVLFGTEECDYAVADITVKESNNKAGYLIGENDCVNSDSNGKLFVSEVLLHRLGEIQVPVDILVVFNDGSEIIEHWDGKKRSHILRYENDKTIECATIDPDHKILLDKNLMNNGFHKTTFKKGVYKYLVEILLMLQNTLQTVITII